MAEGGGGGGGGGGGACQHAAAAYWYDACEDGASLLCGIDFATSADFDPGLISVMDSAVDDGFVPEIDRILESINAESAPAPPPPPAPAPVAPAQPPAEQLQEAAVTVADNVVAVVDSRKRNQCVETRKEPSSKSHGNSANGGGGESRDGKRPRLASGGAVGPRPDWRRRPMPPPPSRGWEERRGRRDLDRPRKRDRDGHSGYEHHRRVARGFWERDRGGKMVFRPGSWEQQSDREAKRDRTQVGGSMEKKAEAD